MLSAALMMLLWVISFVAFIWVIFKIGRHSIIGAILSFFLLLPIFYYLFKLWGDEENDIKVPFAISFGPALVATLWGIFFLAGDITEYFLARHKEGGKLEMAAPPLTPTPAKEAPAVAVPTTVTVPAPAPVRTPAPVAAPRPVQRAEVAREPAKEPPHRGKVQVSNCVFKPVMTDEDMAKCR